MDKLTSRQANKLLVRKTGREEELDRVIKDRVTKGQKERLKGRKK